MAEGTVQANGITLWYETFGDAADPAVVLIMGIGLQGLFWPTAFCARLAAGGRYVIRFDNRETGRSQWFDEDATYTLVDMADDVAGLLDALGIAQAHVVGLSLGGAIAQWVAVRHPARVLSLTSMMSFPYSAADPVAATLPASPLNVAQVFRREPMPETRAERIALGVQGWRQVWGTFPFDDGDITAVVGQMHDRAWRREAMARQGAAAQRTPSRLEALQRLAVPTLVIHGTEDLVVLPDRGEATATVIPGARLVLIEGMGHSLPRACWDDLLAVVLEHTAAAAAPASSQEP